MSDSTAVYGQHISGFRGVSPVNFLALSASVALLNRRRIAVLIDSFKCNAHLLSSLLTLIVLEWNNHSIMTLRMHECCSPLFTVTVYTRTSWPKSWGSDLYAGHKVKNFFQPPKYAVSDRVQPRDSVLLCDVVPLGETPVTVIAWQGTRALQSPSRRSLSVYRRLLAWRSIAYYWLIG